MTMQAFIALGLCIFVFCVVITIFRLRQKIQHRREQILKEIEAAARNRVDAAVPKGIRGAPYADIGLAKPPEVHDLLAQLDMEQTALQKAAFDKILQTEARHKEKLTAQAQKQATEEVLREGRINLYQKVNERRKEAPAAEKKKAFAKVSVKQSKRRQEEQQRQQEQQQNEQKEIQEREKESQRKDQEQNDKNDADKIQELRGVKEAEETAQKSAESNQKQATQEVAQKATAAKAVGGR